MGTWTGLTSACQDSASHVPVVADSDSHVATVAISAWPSSPVWVLMYWRGTLSTSHVHNGKVIESDTNRLGKFSSAAMRNAE